jgi:hypothetical protein
MLKDAHKEDANHRLAEKLSREHKMDVTPATPNIIDFGKTMARELTDTVKIGKILLNRDNKPKSNIIS